MDIPRPRTSFAAIAVLPVVVVPLFRAEGEDFTLRLVVFLAFMAILGAQLLNHGFYLRRTPLVRIDDTSLTFFGNARFRARSFQRHAISGIRLSGRPHFWRSAFRLSVIVDGATVDLWIPHFAGGSMAALAQALREQFPGKFEEVRV